MHKNGQKVSKIDTKNYRQICDVENQIEGCKLGLFQDSFAGGLRDSKSTSGYLLCHFGLHTVCSSFADVQEANRSFSHQDAGLRMEDYQLFNFGNVSWEHYPMSQPRETLSVTHAKESFRLTRILAVVLSQLSTFHRTFPTVHMQPNSTYSRKMRQ